MRFFMKTSSTACFATTRRFKINATICFQLSMAAIKPRGLANAQSIRKVWRLRGHGCRPSKIQARLQAKVLCNLSWWWTLTYAQFLQIIKAFRGFSPQRKANSGQSSRAQSLWPADSTRKRKYHRYTFIAKLASLWVSPRVESRD